MTLQNAQRDGNFVPTITGVASKNYTDGSGNIYVQGVTPVIPFVTPDTHRLLVDNANTSGTFYSDTVSGTINGSNTAFTVPNTISTAMVLFLAGIPYQPNVDFTYSGTSISMTVAPPASLSGQPFWLLHS